MGTFPCGNPSIFSSDPSSGGRKEQIDWHHVPMFFGKCVKSHPTTNALCIGSTLKAQDSKALQRQLLCHLPCPEQWAAEPADGHFVSCQLHFLQKWQYTAENRARLSSSHIFHPGRACNETLHLYLIGVVRHHGLIAYVSNSKNVRRVGSPFGSNIQFGVLSARKIKTYHCPFKTLFFKNWGLVLFLD